LSLRTKVNQTKLMFDGKKQHIFIKIFFFKRLEVKHLLREEKQIAYKLCGLNKLINDYQQLD
jgi:hypothetical protein